MGSITATESVTLDGVMQGVGRADEDTRGGFRSGGWGTGYTDQVVGERMGAGMARTGAMLFGHRTYDDVLGHWTAREPEAPITAHLLRTRKFVVSRDPSTVLGHPESILLAGPAEDTVRELRGQTDGTLSIIGSGELVRALHAVGLIDRYVLLIHPIVLGDGARLFEEGQRSDLRLEDSVVSTTGVIVAEYSVVR